MNTSEFLTISSTIVPDREALVFEGRRITYMELNDRVNRLASGLGQLGVGRGDRVAVLQVNCNEHVEAYFAAAKLDAVYVPLNFRVRSDELAYMLNETSPKVFLVGARYADLVKSAVKNFQDCDNFVALEQRVDGWHYYEDLMVSNDVKEHCPGADEDDLTIVLFTAGTTGRPKGVMLSHASFSSYILANVSPADPETEERNILTVPLYHIAGVQGMMAAVYGGRTIIMQRQFEPVEWMGLVQEERANRAMMVPTMLKMLMDHPRFPEHDLSSLEIITYGAAPMPIDVIKRAIAEFPGTYFINAFGQTETASTITMLSPEDHVLDGDAEEVEKRLRRLSSIGKPLDDVEVSIVDEGGDPVEQGKVGEIVARGDRLMKGYWRSEGATAEVIRDGWLYTGDLGYFDEDGYIFLAGRAKDFIKRGGEMVSPEEVEQVLNSYPAIDECAVIGIPDSDWGERVRAVVVLKPGYTVDESEVSEFCRQRLASFKKPESVVVTSKLPRNPLGKVLKRELRKEFGQPIGSNDD